MARRSPVVEWTLEATGGDVPPAARGPIAIQVPESVSSALVRVGVLADVTTGGSERDHAWVARSTWRCTTTLPQQDTTHGLLVFHGIDTFATVSVDGEPVLAATDMHRTYVVDVTAAVNAGPVEVTVDLHAALPVAEAADETNPLPRPPAFAMPYSQVRKMACSFGWDWGPVTVTAGLWRPVELVTWDTARLADVWVRADARSGEVGVTATVDGGARGLRVSVGGPGLPEQVNATGPADGTTVTVPEPLQWWPHGEGDQPLYDVHVELLADDGAVLDAAHRRVGFRTVEVVQTPDADGSSFEIHVNGRRIWAKGLNWIPDDVYPERVTAQRYRERLQDAVDAGCNLIRIWGGGTFEADDFYDACDELGLMTAQDFLFACAAYPEDDAMVADVRAEAADNVARLRHHTSLVMWCGCNENLWGYEDWGWAPSLGGRPWGRRYYDEVLPALLADLDPGRAYVPGSPFSPDDRPSNADSAGTTHVWDVWNELDYTAYEDHRPRFVSEFGWQAPASWPTLTAALGADDLDPDDPRMSPYQKAEDGERKLATGLARHLPTRTVRGVRWYYAAQLLQARAITTGIGHFRSLHDRCSGTVWWQLNDCWPVISWSVVDVAGRRKPGWYALREAYRPHLVHVGRPQDGLPVTLVNDGAEPWETTLRLTAVTATGAEFYASGEVTVPPRSHVVVSDVPAPDAWALAVVADTDDTAARATRWLLPDVELRLPAQDLVVAVSRRPGGAVVVKARTATVVRDLSLLAELAAPDASVDRAVLTLLPGESAELVVTGGEAVPDDAWAELLWSDNRLRHEREQQTF